MHIYSLHLLRQLLSAERYITKAAKWPELNCCKLGLSLYGGELAWVQGWIYWGGGGGGGAGVCTPLALVRGGTRAPPYQIILDPSLPGYTPVSKLARYR